MTITPDDTFLVPVGHSRISRDGFRRVLRQLAAPGVVAERDPGEYYDAITAIRTPEGTHVDPLLMLAKFNHESSMGRAGVAVTTHSWGNTRKPTFGAVPIGDAPGMSGSFPIFRDWLDGAKSTAARLVAPNYVYYGWGRRTIREIYDWQDDPDTEQDESEIAWAPAGDFNNPSSYLRAVIDFMNDHTDQEGGAVAGKVPKPDMMTDFRSPNYGGYPEPRVIRMICNHTSGGYEPGDLQMFRTVNSCNYYIRRDGKIREVVPPQFAPWTNGWGEDREYRPDLSNPIIAEIHRLGHSPNSYCVTKEHEGEEDSDLTPEQIIASASLDAWLSQEYDIPLDRTHLVGHNQFDSVKRSYCPGFSDAEWNSIIGGAKALRAKYEGTEPSPPADESNPWFLHVGDGSHAQYAFRWGFRGFVEGLAISRYAADPNSAALAIFGVPKEDEWVGEDGNTYQRCENVVLQYIPGNGVPWDVKLVKRGVRLPKRKAA